MSNKRDYWTALTYLALFLAVSVLIYLNEVILG